MKTTLHYYYINLDSAKGGTTYHALCTKLKAEGLRRFDGMSAEGNQFYERKIKPLDGTEVELETKYLFNNQWNTKCGLRVFDWAETIVPNRDIKIGMWLEQTQEMRDIRDNTYKCGYCGAMTTDSFDPFCNECLDSQYLKKDDLKLLRRHPISNDRATFPRLTTEEEAILLPKYIAAQTIAKGSRAAAKREKAFNDVNAKADLVIARATTERDGFMWLLERVINTDNCIYYNHKNVFCFGWRNSVSEEVKVELESLLEGFPFDYYIE